MDVTSKVGLTTDRDLAEPSCLRKTTYFIPPRYRKSRGTRHNTIVSLREKCIEHRKGRDCLLSRINVNCSNRFTAIMYIIYVGIANTFVKIHYKLSKEIVSMFRNWGNNRKLSYIHVNTLQMILRLTFIENDFIIRYNNFIINNNLNVYCRNLL